MSTRYDPAWLDRMYNNRALVPEHAAHFQRWAEDSANVVRSQARTLDLRYGGGPAEHLDVFPATQQRAPVLVFIHGGYWRSLDKKDHAFVAPGFTSQGVCVVVPNYALAPAVTIPQIALQMVRALAWTWRHVAEYGGDPQRITLAGHSAGGHLAAMLLACDWRAYEPDLPRDLVRKALSISGLYDLEPVMHTPFLKGDLRLTAADALRASPALLPAPAQGTLYTFAGADESEEFRRQNRLMQMAWGPARVPVCEELPAHNHFSIVEALAEPGSRLNEMAVQLVLE